MLSWPAPPMPSAVAERFGPAPAVRVHDSATQSAVTTSPEQTARIYVCGITPYDAAHIGHAATYVAFDLLVRAWRDAGYDVEYVKNVTDVDHPLLERSRASGG